MELESLCTVEAHEEGAELQIKHPVTQEDTDVFIRLMGVDSKAFRAHARQRNRLRFTYTDKDGKVTDEPADIAEARDIDLLVEVTLGWRGILQDGKPMEFSKDNLRRLYTNSPAVRAQVDSFILNRKNFTKG